MNSYVYTDMAEKVNSLEAKIRQLEKIYKRGNTSDFEVKKSQYHFESSHYLIDLTRNLKNDIMYKPLGNYYDNKILSQMYEKICILESELNSILLPKRQKPNMERGLIGENHPLVCNVQKLPFNVYNKCTEPFPQQCARPFKRVKVKYNTKQCIPPETFFEKLSLHTNIIDNQTSTDSLEEFIYYDNLSSSSSSSLSSSSVTTLLINDTGSSQPKKLVHSRYVKNVPVDIRMSKPTFREKYKKDELIKPNKVVYSKYSIKSVPIHVSKSRSKPTFKHKRQTVTPENKNRKVWASNISVKKQQKPKEQSRKKTKKQHKSQKNRQPTTFRLSKSESPKMKVYSSNLPAEKQESEIYFIRKPNPKDSNKDSNKEKYYISRLKRMNTPSRRKVGRKAKSHKRNKSLPIILRKTKYSNTKPSRNKSFRFEHSKDKNDKNKSETSMESRYIKTKWERSPYKKRSKFQTKKSYGKQPLVVASSSVVLSTPFLPSRAHNSFLVGFNSSGTSSSNKTSSSSSSESNKGLKRLTSSEISFINSNYEIVGSLYDPNTNSNQKEIHINPTTKERNQRFSQKLPTTVYTVINENPQVNLRRPLLNDDGIVFINGEVSSLNSKNVLHVTRKRFNGEDLAQERNVYEKENKPSNRSIRNNAPIYKYKANGKSILKNPFGEDPIENTVYVSTVPINQLNLPKTWSNNVAQQQNNHSLQTNPNVPETSIKNKDGFSTVNEVSGNQTNLLVDNYNPVLSTSINPISKMHSSLKTVSSKNISKQNDLSFYQVQTEGSMNPSDSKKRFKKILSLERVSRILQSTKPKSKNGSTENLANNHPFKSKSDSKKLHIDSKSIDTSKTSKRSLYSQKTISDNSRKNVKKYLSKNTKPEKLSQKQLRSGLAENKKSGTRIKPILSSISIKNIFRHKGNTKKKDVSQEKNQKGKMNKSSSVPAKLPPEVNRRLANNILDQTSDEVENIYGPRSISQLLQHIDTIDSASTLLQKDIQNENNLKDDTELYPTKQTDGSKQSFIRQNPNIRAEISRKKIPASNQQDYNKLNYSLHFAKSKRRNVEMCSIPSTLSLADIFPSNCKTILSMEEILLSEHKFNGIELHGKLHEIFVRPNHAKSKVNGKYINKPHSNSFGRKLNNTSQDNCKCIGTTHSTNLNFRRNIPIFKSGQISDSSYFVDWRKIAHEVKEYH